MEGRRKSGSNGTEAPLTEITVDGQASWMTAVSAKSANQEATLFLKRGLRKLRGHDYKGAAKLLEKAWNATRPAMLTEDVEEEALAELATAEAHRDVSPLLKEAPVESPHTEQLLTAVVSKAAKRPHRLRKSRNAENEKVAQHSKDSDTSSSDSEDKPNPSKVPSASAMAGSLLRTPPPSDLDTDATGTGTENEDSDRPYPSSVASSWTSDASKASKSSKKKEEVVTSRSDSPFKGSDSSSRKSSKVREVRALKRAAARSRKASEQLARLPMLLCLAYERLEKWEKIDTLVHEALQTFGAANSRGVPIFENLEAENRWVRLLVRRGVACAYLGEEHLDRGLKYFSLALRVQPRCRQASTGAQIMGFLIAQLLPVN